MQKTSMNQKQSEYIEKVIQLDRISRTVKGGRRIRFRALVVIGNQRGKVGIGIAKAQEVVVAITKAISVAKKNIINVDIINDTIPHETKIKHGSAIIYLKPARPGTSIIAGGSVRAVLELSGIKNVVAKILGTSNKINNVQATFLALKNFKKSHIAKINNAMKNHQTKIVKPAKENYETK
ncbi:MAG: 30S ribosomal protein S5 [Bacteroidales bacterium]|nr:30S ribosomal protein S5 [Bacteroidales bacterium]